MKSFGPLVFALLSTVSTLAAGSLLGRAPPGGGYGGGSGGNGGDTDDGDSPAPSASATPGNDTTASSIGDLACSTSMCVAAEVNGNTVRYTLTSQLPEVGWMAVGFGRQMVNSPMVIMWANEDGSITLSQRQATRQSEPPVTPSPARVAALQSSLSLTSGENQQYVFEIPANDDTSQNLIWAFGSTKPTSSAVDARLVQHISEGRMTLDLTKVNGDGGGGGSGGGNDDDAVTIPLTKNEKVLLAHAIVASIGFLIILPIGGLIARYLRTFSPIWFTLHWVIQLVLGGLTVVIGVVLGIVGVSNSGGSHVNSPHKRVGIVLLALFVLQVALGAIIHFVKPRSGRRPPQNYIHAVLGITIVALSLYQARTGYKTEWPESIGRPATNGVNIVWYVWVALLPVAYAVGLFFLPKQLKQEKKNRREDSR